MKTEKARGSRLYLKVALIMVILMLTVMASVGVYLISRVGAYYENSFRTQMTGVFTRDTLETLRKSAAEGAGSLRDMVSAYSGRLGLGTGTDRTFRILDGDTGEILSGGGTPGTQPSFTKNILTALNGEMGIGNRINETCFDVAVPVTAGTERYIVYIRDDKSTANAMERMLLSVILQAVIFGLAVAVLLSFLLSGNLTRPLVELSRGARQVAEGRFGADLPVRAADEIGTLTEDFNHMSRALARSMEELNAEKNRYSSLLVYMTDGVISFDGEGRGTHINPAARKMLSLSDRAPDFGELFGQTDITPAQVLSLPVSGHVETELSRNGLVLQIILSPAGNRGKDRGIVCVVHDVTREKTLEENRRKFVADVSHELRTPLTNIKGYAETIAGDDRMPPAIRKRFLGVVQNEADRMLRIVQDLLTLSKMDNRSMSWNFEWVDLESGLESVNTAMQLRAGEKSQRLSLNMQGTLPLVWCDKARIEQVAVNLIGNAITYTPEGGEIAVTACRAEDSVRIRVTDNGIGIPEKDKAHLFDRFYRVDKARSRESGGTGLGLAITYEIIQKHHGSISVESSEGQGSTFTVLLPIDSGEGRDGE